MNISKIPNPRGICLNTIVMVTRWKYTWT